MRIRNLLILAFLVVTLIPSVFYGWWAYREGVRREFAEVEDRHLLLAQNLGSALERYHLDLVSVTEAVSTFMVTEMHSPKLDEILEGLNIDCVVIYHREAQTIQQKFVQAGATGGRITNARIQDLSRYLVDGKTTFSPVMESSTGENVIYAIKRYNNLMSVAQINTRYFDELGKSISFGRKGHAAIVDRDGNVLAHPLASWVKSRKNIAKVSAVQRMLNGERGIEQFYSPALKGDMIAGFTAIQGPGWGVMIPQPVEELYEKVRENNRYFVGAIGLALILSSAFVWLLLNSVSRPMEAIIRAIRKNAHNGQLRNISAPDGLLQINEVKGFETSYNDMVHKVSDANSEIEQLAYTDSVTKLPNRFKFQNHVAELIDNPISRELGGALIFLDLDNFKIANDLYGHGVGDELLTRFAKKLTEAVGQSSKISPMKNSNGKPILPIVSRIGGDEFTIVMPGLVEDEDLEPFLNQLLASIGSVNGEVSYKTNCSASIGCARYPKDSLHVSELMRLADMARYEAKNAGKGCAKIYNPEIGVRTQNEIRTEFADAISSGQLFLEYQPKVCSESKQFSGVEALVRWNHPKLGKLTPQSWLPAITKTSLGIGLTEWVIQRAMEDMRTMKMAGHDIPFAVNICSHQLSGEGLESILTANAEKFEIEPSKFEIEITEDAIFENEDAAFDTINNLSELGFKISIDDFGTGYSNLSRLAGLPIDFIKLDRSLVAGGYADEKIRIILNATAAMAKLLNYNIVAEGIENIELAVFAEEMGANLLQGYFFSQSLPVEQLFELLEAEEVPSVQAYRNIDTDKRAA